MRLTAFEPATNETHCCFHRPSLDGEAVGFTEVSRTEAGRAESWICCNDERPVTVALELTGTGEGYEFRGHTGTIQITDRVNADPIQIEGRCGV